MKSFRYFFLLLASLLFLIRCNGYVSLPIYFKIPNSNHVKKISSFKIASNSLTSSNLSVEVINQSPKATLKSSVINLAKNCIGAGVFSIHSRISTKTGPLPFPVVIGLAYLMAAWATYNFYIVGEACRITNSSTYPEAWSRSVSEDSKWLVQTVVITAPIVSCLANVIVLTDILKLLLKSLGFPEFVHGNRNVVISILGTFILYPLNIQSNLSALQSISVIGLSGHVGAMGALVIRLLDKSYLPGGYFHSAMISLPVIASDINLLTSKVGKLAKWSTLASLLSYCLVTHYNAPRYYSELKASEKERSPDKKTSNPILLPTFAYLAAATVYLLTAWLSLALLGTRAPVFALNGFSSTDWLGTAARVSFGLSVLASFPLIFLAMRNWFVTQATKFVPALGDVKKMTAVLLFGISLAATKCTDIGLVGSIAGGLLGSSMMFVFPPIMYIQALRYQAKKNNLPSPMSLIIVNSILLVLGGCLGVLGTTNSILSSIYR